MAISNITTEDGSTLVQENVAGVTGASSLNDTNVAVIYSDPLTVDPLTNGWLVGSGWSWNSVGKYFQ